MQNPAFSIIIPAFNNQDTLSRTLNSLRKQDISLFEIILVDDASKDETIKIAEEYQNRFPAFHIISHLNNKGMFEARKTGVEKAKGSYILFLDADDEIVPGFMKHLLFFIEQNQNEIITFKAAIPGKNEEQDPFLSFINYTFKEKTNLKNLYPFVFEKRVMSYRVWGRAYKTSYIKPKYQLMPSSYINTSEDAAQTFFFLNSKTAKMSFYNELGYIYHFGEGSSTENMISLADYKKKAVSSLEAISMMGSCMHIKQDNSLNKNELLYYLSSAQNTIIAWLANTWASQLDTPSKKAAMSFFQTTPFAQSINCELLRPIRDVAYEDYSNKSSRHFYELVHYLFYILNHSTIKSAQYFYFVKAAVIHLTDIKNQFLPKTLKMIFSKMNLHELDRLYRLFNSYNTIPTPGECKDREIIPLFLESSNLLTDIDKTQSVLNQFSAYYFDIYSKNSSGSLSNTKKESNFKLNFIESKKAIPYQRYEVITREASLQETQEVVRIINNYHCSLASF